MADIIEFTFAMFRTNFKLTVIVVAILTLPGAIVFGYGSVLLGSTDSLAQFEQPSVTALVLVAIGGLALSLGSLGAEAAIMSIAVQRAEAATQPSWSRAALIGVRRAFPILGLWIVLGLGAVLPFLAVLVATLAIDGTIGLLFIPVAPATFFLVLVVVMMGLLSIAAAVAEDTGLWRGFGRVRQLLRGQFWRTFGRGLLFGLMIGILTGVASVVGSFAGFSPRLLIVATVLGQVVQLIVATPLQALAGLGMYADLRVRAEGVDQLGLL